MLTIEYVKDPIWANQQNTAINLIVKWEEFNEEMPFTATPNDVEPYGVELFNRAVASEFGEVTPFVEPIQPTIDFEPTPTNPSA